MRRVIGFALLCMAGGMVVDMLLPHTFARFLCAVLLGLAGYILFFCGEDGHKRR